jgi:phosphatidylinositol alpha-1,6-mannosyltransferase
MKILYVAPTFFPRVGGAENHIDSIASEMSRRGHEVMVLAPKYENTETESKRNGYRIIRANFHEEKKRGILYYLRVMSFKPTFTKVLDEVSPDIVHFQFIPPFATLFPIVKFKGGKCFASAHGNEVLFMKKDWLGKHVLDKVIKNLDGVIAVSEYTNNLLSKKLKMRKGHCQANCYNQKCNGRIHTVYNGVNPENFEPSYKFKGSNILTICRLVERKGVDVLLKAYQVVLKKHKDLNLTIIGKGPDDQRLQNLAKELDVSDHVTFTGEIAQKELHKAYQKCDMFVMTSRSLEDKNEVEGFGITLVEAMASGKPVIAGKSGGMPSAVKPAWGYLVDPLDHLELAKKISYLLDHPNLGERMGRKGRTAVEEIYNWKNLCDCIERIYNTT